MSKLPDDPRFAHVDYYHTDVTRTWARERKRLAELAVKAEAEKRKPVAKVQQINRSKV